MECFVTIIKPTLESFLVNPTKENVNKLQNTIENVDWNEMRTLETYILAPLIMKLDKLPEEKTSDLRYEIVNCIKTLIKKSHIKSINQLKTNIIIILKQIHDFDSGMLQKNLSEELKLSVISCLSEILIRTNNDILEIFYTKQNSNLIGKIAATCVDILQNDKYKKLRITTIQCLQCLFYVYDAAEFNDIILRAQVADATFFFLPKIIAVLTEIALGDEKTGESLITLTVKTLGRILHLIYEDQNELVNDYSVNDFIKLISEKNVNLPETDDLILGSNIKNKSVEEKLKIIQDMKRNIKWFKKTSQKLNSIFIKLQILQSNNNDNVRKNYAIFNRNLLRNCSVNLSENTYIFLESVIALSQDDNFEIKKICEEILCEINSKSNISVDWEQLFNQHMIKLPRIITRNDDLEQIAEFLFLKGFFKNIPEQNLCTIFSFQHNIERFTNNIIQTLNIKFSSDLLNEEYANSELKDEIDKSYQWRKFCNISSLKAVNLLQSMCEHIGSSTINFIIFNYLIEYSNNNLLFLNEIYLFLNFLITNNENNFEGKEKLVDLLLIELNDEKHWHLALKPDDVNRINNKENNCWYIDRTPGLYESSYEVRMTDIASDTDFIINNKIVNRIDAQFNVLHNCIILESIGNCALILKKKFNIYVFKFLHRVLLKLNSTNLFVHKSAFITLNNIKDSLNYKCFSKLIYEYSDYLSYYINRFLKKSELNESGISILAIVLKYSSLESFSHLENILITLLEELSKSNQSTCTVSYLRVFNIFLKKIQEWLKYLKDELVTSDTEIITEKIEENLLTILKGILYKPMIEYDIQKEEKSNENNETDFKEDWENLEENNENNNTNIPKYIALTVEILKNVLKFISSKEQIHKIIALECMISGLPTLKDYENELLPLVHLVWYPYAERFKDSDPVVLNRCFTLLEILADCSKSFIQKRSLKDIIPFLNQFLQNSLKNSLKNRNITSTQEHKLQLKLLRGYAKIIINLDIQQEYLEEVTNIIILYLNKNQPLLLQESAVFYLIEISNYNKPLLYIKLLYYINDISFRDNIIKVFNKMNIEVEN